MYNINIELLSLPGQFLHPWIADNGAMARCDELLLIMFSVHVVMMLIVRDDFLFHS